VEFGIVLLFLVVLALQLLVKIPKALFTSRVFSHPRGLGIVGELVKPLISPNPHIHPHFPLFPNPIPTPSSYFEFGDERGYERIEIRK
jgi:hypothetical protein